MNFISEFFKKTTKKKQIKIDSGGVRDKAAIE
mgnify:CR=1 FL=1